MVKEPVLQEDIIILNVYKPNNRVLGLYTLFIHKPKTDRTAERNR